MAQAALVVAAAGLLATGVWGLGRTSTFFGDYSIVYAAGRTLVHRHDPYDQAQLMPELLAVDLRSDPTAPYSYPPHFSALVALLGLADYRVSTGLWLLVQLVSIGLSTYLACVLVVPTASAAGVSSSERWWFAAMAIGNPMVSNDLWLGQPVALAYLGILVLWHGIISGRPALSGIGLALALIKPQVGLLVLIWLILERDYRSLAFAGGLIFLLSLYHAVVVGPFHVVPSWLARVATHTNVPTNAPGSEHVIGLRSLFACAGVPLPGLELMGVVLAGFVWRKRAGLGPLDRLGLLMALTLLFVFNMDSAYICLIPLVGALWIRARQDPMVLWTTVGLGLAFCFPRRVVRSMDLPILNHWRTVLVFLMASLLLLAFRRAVPRRSALPSSAPEPTL